MAPQALSASAPSPTICRPSFRKGLPLRGSLPWEPCAHQGGCPRAGGPCTVARVGVHGTGWVGKGSGWGCSLTEDRRLGTEGELETVQAKDGLVPALSRGAGWGAKGCAHRGLIWRDLGQKRPPSRPRTKASVHAAERGRSRGLGKGSPPVLRASGQPSPEGLGQEHRADIPSLTHTQGFKGR